MVNFPTYFLSYQYVRINIRNYLKILLRLEYYLFIRFVCIFVLKNWLVIEERGGEGKVFFYFIFDNIYKS